MKYLLIVIIACCIGCQNKPEIKKTEPIRLVRAFKNAGNWDSVYLYSDGHLNIINRPIDSFRYFIISFLWRNSNREDFGNMTIRGKNFPNELECSEEVSKERHLKITKEHPVIFTSIFEFKSEADYEEWRSLEPSNP